MFAKLFARKKVQLRNKIAAAEADFCRAWTDYQDACRRGDTRDQSAAWEALHHAQNERLRRDLSSTAIGWRGAR